MRASAKKRRKEKMSKENQEGIMNFKRVMPDVTLSKTTKPTPKKFQKEKSSRAVKTKGSNPRNVNSRNMKPRALILLVGVVIVAVVGILGVRSAMISYLERYSDDIFLTGVSIDGIDMSGKTRSQGLEELMTQLNTLQRSNITFSLGGGRSFSGALRDIGLSIDNLETVVEEAFYFGREGSLFQRVRLLQRANSGRLELEFPLRYEVSMDSLTQLLESHMEEHLNIPMNARLESGPYGVRIIPDQMGEVFDIEATYYEISSYINNYWDRVSAAFPLEVIREEADLTASQLEGVSDLLGTFTTTFFDSTESRAQNVANGARHINHLFLMPGEEVSACTLMRPYTVENGYAYGNMFAGNLIIEAIGGGVCQVTTTLYMALLYAEIEILQRNAHTMPVAYVPYSMDAAVAEGLLDLRFRNNMDTPIYIEAVVVPGQSITYNIFGRETRPANRRIEFVSEATYGDAPGGAQFVASQYGIGAMWLISEARAPISARLIKVIFIDDVEVERVQVNFSYYLESPRIWSVGTAANNPDNTALILGAIGSQNYEYIRSTINRILSGGHPAAYSPDYSGGYQGGYSGGYPEGYTDGYSGNYSYGY